MKFITLFSNAEEANGQLLDTPNVCSISGSTTPIFADESLGSQVMLVNDGGTVKRCPIVEQPLKLYKTDMNDEEYSQEVDYEDYFILDGTYEYEGETFYKFKKFDNGGAGTNLNIYILTDTLDFSNVSLENPYTPVGTIWQDELTIGENQYPHSEDKIVDADGCKQVYLDITLNNANNAIWCKTSVKMNYTITYQNINDDGTLGQIQTKTDFCLSDKISQNNTYEDRTVKVTATVYGFKLSTTITQYAKEDIDIEMIDLGLQSGTLWSNMNIGATTESGYGNLYQWGSLVDNSNTPCDWVHAPFNNGSSDFDQAYFDTVKDTVCPNGVLASQYDVATQTYGAGYRMPTKAEFDELISGTNNEWITNYNGTGINGRKFTNKSDSTKFIFIPAAGYRWNSSTFSIGSDANVWSASLDTDYEDRAWYLYFISDVIDTYYDSRYGGMSVRSVS